MQSKFNELYKDCVTLVLYHHKLRISKILKNQRIKMNDDMQYIVAHFQCYVS